MTKTNLLKSQGIRTAITVTLLLIPLFLLLGLNYIQLYTAWQVRNETRRLVDLAAKAPAQFQNPSPAADDFEGKLRSDFWDFTIINGGGKVSNEVAWHAAEIALDRSLVLRHFSDPAFKDETAEWHVPAADQYNNISLIGGSGFRPDAAGDVVLKFTAQVSEKFYGSAGVIFQPMGTIQKDGEFVKPFDMFGFTVTGGGSEVRGISGPVCYLALNFFPVEAEPLQVDTQGLHTYEIRLRWVDQTEWLGSVKVDGATQCQMAMPAFGPVEVHVWSDNTFAQYQPRRWWEIAPATDFSYQDGGDKEFSLGMIQISEEPR